MNYYNEFDPYAAQWLRNLITQGLIPEGTVDERSIKDVDPAFLEKFTQCHFFAGIGGWPLALRLAGWPDDRPVWTGSCPCQPFSAAGRQKGVEDERDLWPIWDHLIAQVEPPVIFGEQVSAAIGHDWLDRMRVDMEAKGYALGAAVLPACAVDAPHRRDRLFFVADAEPARREGGLHGSGSAESAARQGKAVEPQRSGAYVADTVRSGWSPRGAVDGFGPVAGDGGSLTLADALDEGPQGWLLRGSDQEREALQRHAGRNSATHWSDAEWITGADGKARRFEPSIRLLAHGVPARVGKLRAFGNAIVPQVAAEFIAAYLECQ